MYRYFAYGSVLSRRHLAEWAGEHGVDPGLFAHGTPAVLRGLEGLPVERLPARHYDEGPIRAVHDDDFVSYLENTAPYRQFDICWASCRNC